jgi:hypothetical protein
VDDPSLSGQVLTKAKSYMDEADFAAKILGTTPEELDTYGEDESLTNEEESTQDEVQNPKEESRTLEQNEHTDTQQEETSETTQNPPTDNYSKRKLRAERYARLRAESNTNAQSENDFNGVDVSEGGEFTAEEWRQIIREEAKREALEAYREEKLREYEEEITQDWISDVEELAQQYPELDPESKQYNKDIDDLLTQMVTNPDGSVRLDITVSEAFNKILALQEQAAIARSHQNKAKITKQIDESAITGDVDGDLDKSELNLDEMDSQDIFDLAKAGKL